MKAFRSISWRLQFWYALLLAAVLAGFAISAYEIERADLVRSADADLDRRVADLSRVLRPPPPPVGGPRRPPESQLPLRPGPPGFDRSGPDSGPPRPSRLALRFTPQQEADYGADSAGTWYYVIWLRNGPAVTRSPRAPANVPRPDVAEPGQSDRNRRIPGGPTSVSAGSAAEGDTEVAPPNFAATFVAPFRSEGPVLRSRGDIREAYVVLGPGDVILAGHSLTADFQHLHHLAWLMTSAAGLILALGLLGGRWLVGRSLKPIAEISAAAAKIAAGNLSERIGTRDTDSELGELAQVLDATFARLEASFSQQARFTADAAHELRTPVTVLLTHTQNALAVRCESDEHREALEACQRAAQRMRALTESLLWLARLDSGGQVLKKVPVDLAARVSECIALIRPLADKRGITVRAELNPVECVGDPGQIDQVITNLLANAIDHNVERGEVRVATQAGPGGATLTVADNGPGIDAAHLAHVFDRFNRADKSRSRSSGGVGLGLAIAKAIVEAHGGSIRVESEPGRGAAFTARFPSSRS